MVEVEGFGFGGTGLGEALGEMGEDPPEVALVGGTQPGNQPVRAVGVGGRIRRRERLGLCREFDQCSPPVGGVRCPPGKAFLLETLDEQMSQEPAPTQRPMTRRTLVAFFALAFGLGWGVGALMVVFNTEIESVFGEIGYTNPVFILVVYSPAIAGVCLVWRHYGIKGLGSFFRRFTLWRMPAAWWLFLVLGIPAGTYWAPLSTAPSPISRSIPGTGCCRYLRRRCSSGRVEEIGWRGVALPLLQRR